MPGKRASAALLVVAVVVAGVLVVTHDGRPQVAPGTEVEASGATAGGRTLAVKVPWGALDVQVGPARDGVRRDGEEVRVDDGRFVFVSVKTDTGTLLPLARRPGWTLHGPELALVSGGRSYPLRDARSAGTTAASGLPSRWVAVRGDGDDVRLRVGYEGRSETIDPRAPKASGAFTALDAVAAEAKTDRPKVPCGPEEWSGDLGRAPRVPAPRCAVVRVEPAPFVGGLGWARAGRTWLIVNADADVPLRLARGSTTYAEDATVNDPPPRYTLDGAKPVLAYAVNDVGDVGFKDVSNPDQAIFDVAAGAAGQTLAIALPVAGRRLSGPGPVTRSGTLRWAAALP